MNTYLDTLKAAITDTGVWKWWRSDLPGSVQLEFGCAQLWCQASDPNKPPSSLVALRLIHPRIVTFLADASQPDDWFQAMQRDELEPFPTDSETFTLTDHVRARAILASAAKSRSLVVREGESQPVNELAVVAFMAGPVGFYGVAESVEVYNLRGQLSPEQVRTANSEWWRYWREYWQRQDGPQAMPYDWTCEITIPVAPE